MAYLRDNKELSLKALVERHTEALGTLRTTQHNGKKSAGFVWNKIAGDIGRKHTLGLYLEEPKNNPPTHIKLPILHVYLDSQALIQDFSTDSALYQAKMAYEGLPVQAIKFHLSKKTSRIERKPPKEASFNSSETQNSPGMRGAEEFKKPGNHQKNKNAPLSKEQQEAVPFWSKNPHTHNQIKEREEAAWILRNRKGAHLAPPEQKETTPFNELPPLSPREIQFIQKSVRTLPGELKRIVVSAMSARLRRQKDV